MFEENTPVVEQPQEPSPENVPETPVETPEAPAPEAPVEEAPPEAPEEGIDYDGIVEEAVQEPTQKTEEDKARHTAKSIFKRHPKLKDEMLSEEQEESDDRIYHKLNQDRALELCDDLTKNPKEAKAIYKIWESGQGFRKKVPLKEQLKDVQAIINRKKNEQLAKLKDQEGEDTPSPSGPGHRPGTKHKEPKLPAEVDKVLGKKTWDAKEGVWILKNGRKVSPAQLDLPK